MTTGWKSILLKPLDPLFSKKGAGTEVPIKITGTESAPHFGLDFGHKDEQKNIGKNTDAVEARIDVATRLNCLNGETTYETINRLPAMSKASATLPAIVEKIIKFRLPVNPRRPKSPWKGPITSTERFASRTL